MLNPPAGSHRPADKPAEGPNLRAAAPLGASECVSRFDSGDVFNEGVSEKLNIFSFYCLNKN